MEPIIMTVEELLLNVAGVVTMAFFVGLAIGNWAGKTSRGTRDEFGRDWARRSQAINQGRYIHNPRTYQRR